MATASHRLIGTPILVNEAGALIGSDASAAAPITVPCVGPRATNAPNGSLKRLLGTPCFVTASGAIVASPFAHHRGLKRLLGTPCFVTEAGAIVGSPRSVQVEHPGSFSRATGHPATPRRLLGTPCFVTANGEITGPVVCPIRPSGPRRLLGTPCFVAEDGHFVDSPAHPVPAAVPMPVRQAQTPPNPNVTFSAFPNDSFCFRVDSDKLETVVVLQSEKSLTKW